MEIKLFYYEVREFAYFECNEMGVLYRLPQLSSVHEIHPLKDGVLVTKEKFSERHLQEFINEQFNPEVVKLCYKKRTLAELLKNDEYYPLYVEMVNKYENYDDIPYEELTRYNESTNEVITNILPWQFYLLKKEFTDIVNVKVVCQHCGSEHHILLDRQDLLDYKIGKSNINIFNYLSNSDRELLISQTCDECWNHLMKSDEE